MRNADELAIRELDPGALVAVVEQHVDTCGFELGIEAFRSFANTWGFWRVNGDNDHLEGRNGVRQMMPASIMVLLDGRGNDACHTDSVATHEQRVPCPIHRAPSAHGVAVLPAELEDVAHFDAARDG
jgi:hypothetical protein